MNDTLLSYVGSVYQTAVLLSHHPLLVFYAEKTIRIGALLLIGIPLVNWVSNSLSKFFTTRFSQHIGVLVSHIVFYIGLIVIGVTVLHECGFNVTALLGAAGVFGVAIGFASQTSISNIISGIFLVVERPFSVGDMIKSGEITGIVQSIDLISVRVRTVDNKLVRLPNEMVLKGHLTNLTYYPTKRIDCTVSLPYDADIPTSIKIIRETIAHNPLFLSKPGPYIAVNKIAKLDVNTEIRVSIVVNVWIDKDKASVAMGTLIEELKKAFDNAGMIMTVGPTN